MQTQVKVRDIDLEEEEEGVCTGIMGKQGAGSIHTHYNYLN